MAVAAVPRRSREPNDDRRIWCPSPTRAKAWRLGEVLAWGLAQARSAGFASVVVACEPTGHRPRVLDETAAGMGLTLVCVQPMLTHRAREAEDFTRNKSDAADAVVIARLVAELRCYLPERTSAAYARLRHLGARRGALTVAAGAARQQIRDLVECAWPAALASASNPLDSISWRAAMNVATERIGVATGRPGAFERIGFAPEDLARLSAALGKVEGRMLGVLDELHLRRLTESIPGVSAIGVAAILAEAGDLTRFASARSLVKHAGLCPRENSSGAYAGQTHISGRGRPLLRIAAGRAVGGVGATTCQAPPKAEPRLGVEPCGRRRGTGLGQLRQRRSVERHRGGARDGLQGLAALAGHQLCVAQPSATGTWGEGYEAV